MTDENAEPKILVPGHPVFNTPNTIGRGDWDELGQERGLYFTDTAGRDPQYGPRVVQRALRIQQGREARALVEAKVGQGRWIYVGLGLWRSSPQGPMEPSVSWRTC